MKRVFQYRYYWDNSPLNVPSNLTAQDMAVGGAFSQRMPIYQVGIQTLPGTKVYINSPYEGDPIIINKTGVFEIEAESQSTVTSLRIDKSSLNKIATINDGEKTDAYLIMDIIYEDETSN